MAVGNPDRAVLRAWAVKGAQPVLAVAQAQVVQQALAAPLALQAQAVVAENLPRTETVMASSTAWIIATTL